MLVTHQENMLILQAGQIKIVIKTQDSTNANLSEYSNVLGCKQLQIRMMGMFLSIIIQQVLMVEHCYLFDPEEMFLYFMTRMKKGTKSNTN